MGCWWFGLGKKSGYSLIELLVVLGVITLLVLTAFPVVFGRNDRLLLDSSANMIRQMIIDARVRSIAPSDSSDSRTAQFYQVVFGTFNKDNVNLIVEGGVQTNKISLERGKILCASGAFQGGSTLLRQLRLPRGIYISKFYPSNQTHSDPSATVRFTVSQAGFHCGNYGNPIFNSVGVFDFAWSGNKVDIEGRQKRTASRYLMIELASQKISEKRYIFIDRFTSEVIVSRNNIQGYFEPESDAFSPKWQDTSDSSFTLNINCRASDSTIFVFYHRAEDRYKETETDPNLAVYYDLSWSPGSGGNLLPLEQRYFYDLSSDIVVYTFTTTAYSIANQPATLRFRIVAYDEWGRAQDDNDNDEALKPRDKTFGGLGCGNISAEETDSFKSKSQENPFGQYSGCEVAKTLKRKESGSSYLGRLLGIELVQAQFFSDPDCTRTEDPDV